ncbi:5-formyltetrahydrofolate cyclo-ligase [Candidatus Magnetomonas plexicatena]|uniref:5-formyltetrahydrofolate cyclo-ligase n=1 Tax=Candidatus Magnetomonas plexicatena TaxID=2552947 RepID=UPI001C75FFFE|nr:5-formyltetrahydrofolate cyclo-ligase [Nitrospirales bacterium LBB_01]
MSLEEGFKGLDSRSESGMTNEETKAALRKRMLSVRDSLNLEDRSQRDEMIKENLFSLAKLQAAACVMFFASFKTEPDTFPMIKRALDMKKVVVLPKVDREKHILEAYKINDLNSLKLGYMGILEPDSAQSEPIDGNSIDVIVMPGAAFDRAGGRLGYGGGYYDGFISALSKRPYLIAICYAEQVVPIVPVESHDVRVNKIVTDFEVIDVNG